MVLAVGQKVQASDYNTLRTKVDNVLGLNSDGYGQTLTSSAQIVGNDVSVTAWNNLRDDLIRSRYHQTGVDPSGSLTQVTSADKITYTVFNQADAFADVVVTNKRLVASTQGSVESVQSSTTTTPWKVSLVHTVIVNFSSAAEARYFFNAGGDIRIRAYRSGTAATTKDTTWTSMLGDNNTINGQGTIYMNYTETGTVPNSFDTSPSDQRGTGSAIGFYDLTTTNQQIYIKNAPSGAYSENFYQIQARVNILPDPTSVTITINFVDADTGGPALSPAPGSSPGTPPGPVVDETITGTTGSVVTVFRPSGANVSVNGPSSSSQVSVAGS
jgi:hypothetical protein